MSNRLSGSGRQNGATKLNSTKVIDADLAAKAEPATVAFEVLDGGFVRFYDRYVGPVLADNARIQRQLDEVLASAALVAGGKQGKAGSTTTARKARPGQCQQPDAERLAEEFTSAAGRAVLSLQQAADAVGLHPSTLRRAIGSGELRCSRRATNGPVSIRATELARWFMDGERRTFPDWSAGD